jgi:hypothetical protein
MKVERMRDREDVFKMGVRIRLSSLGIERSSKKASRAGVIVGMSSRTTAIRVLLDGRKMPDTLHASYIELE